MGGDAGKKNEKAESCSPAVGDSERGLLTEKEKGPGENGDQ